MKQPPSQASGSPSSGTVRGTGPAAAAALIPDPRTTGQVAGRNGWTAVSLADPNKIHSVLTVPAGTVVHDTGAVH